jgi:hypothetical protein
MCALGGIDVDALPYVETTIDRVRVRAAYNGGYLVARRESGVLEHAADIFTRSVMQRLRPRVGSKEIFASTGWVGPIASEYWGSNQTATAVAIWSKTLRVKELDRRYNVPLHLLAKQKDLGAWAGINPLHVHYHWMLNPEHAPQALGLLSLLGVPREASEWLKERIPLAGGAMQHSR